MESSVAKSQPKAVPDSNTLRKAIPAHCFTPNQWLSFGYIVRDAVFVAALTFAALQIKHIESEPVRWILWAAYGLVQGFVFTGIWILAHECGHGALFKHQSLNTSLGFTLHSFLLVPYFSWKYSHSRHHRYANDMARDTAFVPTRKDGFRMQEFLHKTFEISEDAPFLNAALLVGHQLVGWPVYLLFNITAGPQSMVGDKSGDRKRWLESHFDPQSAIFSSAERPYILLTDLGMLTMGGLLYLLAQQVGVKTMLLLYLVPWLWVNHWIVVITYLHHTHPDAAHYETEAWTFQKGALSTVDRDFGFVGRHLFHGIIEYHVIHHLFPRIPFYHAEEATKAITGLLGEKYLRQDTPFLQDFWTTFTKTCMYVDQDSLEPGKLNWIGQSVKPRVLAVN